MVVRAERVLFITTSVGEVGDARKRTGLWCAFFLPGSCTAASTLTPSTGNNVSALRHFCKELRRISLASIKLLIDITDVNKVKTSSQVN